VHKGKQALNDAGFECAAFPQRDERVEYIYLQGEQAVTGEKVSYDEVTAARRARFSNPSNH
jgi:hypothetical protein